MIRSASEVLHCIGSILGGVELMRVPGKVLKEFLIS